MNTSSDNSSYDVFLCHNAKDKVEVRAIKQVLIDHGINAWMDEDGLLVGKSWYEQIFESIGTFRSIAVFIGAHGIGDIQKQEIENALRTFESEGKPVIPVILKGFRDANPDIPPFVEAQLISKMNWVDFNVGKRIALIRLIAGIKRTPPEDVVLCASDAYNRIPDPTLAKSYRSRFCIWWVLLHLVGFVAISLLSEFDITNTLTLVSVILTTLFILFFLLHTGFRQMSLEGIQADRIGIVFGILFGTAASVFIIQQASGPELLKSIGALATCIATGILAGAAGSWIFGAIASILAGFGAIVASSLAPWFSSAAEVGTEQLPTGVIWISLSVGTVIWAFLLAYILLSIFSHHQLFKSKTFLT